MNDKKMSENDFTKIGAIKLEGKLFLVKFREVYENNVYF
jgi:hypothetical protein